MTPEQRRASELLKGFVTLRKGLDEVDDLDASNPPESLVQAFKGINTVTKPDFLIAAAHLIMDLVADLTEALNEMHAAEYRNPDSELNHEWHYDWEDVWQFFLIADAFEDERC